ncbi:MAG: type II toxin-antitoxin system VapC family toxin [Dehalococcoidia bacterium]|nr:type II toxin-antitoxin system VapC family toxin [Dehalococcoidia bacterium]
MILYLDTSSLVKLYVEEAGSQEVRDQVAGATAVATATIAHVEARAAFARKRRQGGLSEDEYRHVLDSFREEWPAYLSVDLSEAIINLAGDLTEGHDLRGFDAIHFASALALADKLESPVVFSCADERLKAAARDRGLTIPGE